MAANPSALAGNGAHASPEPDGDEEEEEVEEYEEVEEEEEVEEYEEEEEEDTAQQDPNPQTTTSPDPKDEKTLDSATESQVEVPEIKKWPGWPGDNVFRLVVPVVKVGGLIGRKGELIKKLCDETKASIRIFDGPVGDTERVVLISGKEEPDLDISPAMDAALRIFKYVAEIPDGVDEGTKQSTGPTVSCSARLIVAESQATSLIGKKGQVVKSIQEASGATIRIFARDKLPPYVAADERIVDVQGESFKVLKALEAVVTHLRKFLVDHSVLPLFKKNHQALVSQIGQDHHEDIKGGKAAKVISHSAQPSSVLNYGASLKRDSLYSSDSHTESQILRTELALYGQDLQSEIRASRIGQQSTAAFVTQITQTMQIPLAYAEDIIGIRGANIAYIRETSGATITIQETRGYPEDEIVIEIKGTSSQVHTAHDLIQEFMGCHRRLETSGYASLDGGLRSPYSQLPSTAYASSLSAGYDPYDYSGLSDSRLSRHKRFRS